MTFAQSANLSSIVSNPSRRMRLADCCALSSLRASVLVRWALRSWALRPCGPPSCGSRPAARDALRVGGRARKTPAARRFCTTCVASCARRSQCRARSRRAERDPLALGVGARADRPRGSARRRAGVESDIVHALAEPALEPRLNGGRQRTRRGGAGAFDLFRGVMARASGEPARRRCGRARRRRGRGSAERPCGAPCRLRP